MKTAMKVVQVAIDTLVPADYNPRQWSEAEITALDRSLKKFGFVEPILVNSNPKRKNVIVGGHFRCARWAALGNTMVPAVFLDLTEKKERELNVRLNRNTGSFDYRLLKEHFGTRDLIDYGFDVPTLMENSFDIPADLLPVTSGKDPDETPPVPEKAVSVLGDVWLMGKHRLMCGDSTIIDSVDRLMDGVKASLVVTDPPWNVAYGTNLANNAQGYKAREIMNDNFSSNEEWAKFLHGTMACIVSATLPGCPLYCVMGASEWPAVDKALREAGFHWSSTIIWAKDTLVLSRKDYHTQYEPIWYGWKEDAARIWVVKDRKQSDLWQCDRPKRSELHPTTKPVELIERAINNSSNAGVYVYEPFGGSGSTLIACDKNGRWARCMELDPKYCDVIVKRWQDFTGKQAIHEGTGLTFEELTKKRSKGK